MRYTKKRMSRKTNLGKRRKSYARKYKIRTKKRGGTYGRSHSCEDLCWDYAHSCQKYGMKNLRCKECVKKCKENQARNIGWYYGQDPGDISRSALSDL